MVGYPVQRRVRDDDVDAVAIAELREITFAERQPVYVEHGRLLEHRGRRIDADGLGGAERGVSFCRELARPASEVDDSGWPVLALDEREEVEVRL